MVKINMELRVAFEGMKEVVDTLVTDNINKEYDKEKMEPCIINITDLQARSIIKAYNNALQFVCCGGTTSYYTGDNLVIQHSENGMCRCYIINSLNTIGLVRDLENGINKIDAISTILEQ